MASKCEQESQRYESELIISADVFEKVPSREFVGRSEIPDRSDIAWAGKAAVSKTRRLGKASNFEFDEATAQSSAKIA